MAVDLSRILGELERLQRLVEAAPVFRRAVVTSVNPLLVRLDGASEPLEGSPSSLVAGLVVGDFVQVLLQDRRATVQGRVGGGVTGVVEAFAGSVPPQGALLAQGQSLIRLDYPALFSVIGTTYGSDGSATFKLPDLRDRSVIGVGADADWNALGKTYGAKNHQLTPDQLPGGVLGVRANNTSWGAEVPSMTVGGGSFGSIGRTSAPDTPHNNMPPVFALNYIIWT